MREVMVTIETGLNAFEILNEAKKHQVECGIVYSKRKTYLPPNFTFTLKLKGDNQNILNFVSTIANKSKF